jgi:hypothetical protein
MGPRREPNFGATLRGQSTRRTSRKARNTTLVDREWRIRVRTVRIPLWCLRDTSPNHSSAVWTDFSGAAKESRTAVCRNSRRRGRCPRPGVTLSSRPGCTRSPRDLYDLGLGGADDRRRRRGPTLAHLSGLRPAVDSTEVVAVAEASGWSAFAGRIVDRRGLTDVVITGEDKRELQSCGPSRLQQPQPSHKSGHPSSEQALIPALTSRRRPSSTFAPDRPLRQR